ncbi:RICIN domain-containing protein [Olsenella massiliensis]|uniref:RICIN domain-containing protein n=1 Tax=Olsenella massiliensis TaxID=1622075 RepID=UPI00071D2F34|nr:RICIN domain-containing protein [Olsenella massiliensis]
MQARYVRTMRASLSVLAASTLLCAVLSAPRPAFATPADAATTRESAGALGVVLPPSPEQPAANETSALAPEASARTEDEPSPSGQAAPQDAVQSPPSSAGESASNGSAAGEPKAAPPQPDASPAPDSSPEPPSEPGPSVPPVAEGEYVIESVNGGRKVLDVTAGSTSDGANVQAYESNMSPAQRWRLTFHEDSGCYTIGLAGTSKVLDVSAASARDGANVQIWDDNGTDAQLWTIVKMGGSYQVVSRLRRDLVLDLAGGRTANGTNVQVYTANGTASQGFLFLPATVTVAPGATLPGTDGSYQLISGPSSLGSVVVGRAGSSDVRLLDKDGSPSQRLYLKRDAKGYYAVYAIESGKVLEARYGSVVPGTRVQLAFDCGSAQQRWALVRNANGSYGLVNKASGLALGVADALAGTAGAGLQTLVANEGEGQWFWLEAAANLAAGPAVTDKAGTYIIRSANSLVQVIDSAGGGSADGTNVQTYQSTMSGTQRWTLSRVGDYYTVARAGTSQVLDVQAAGLRDGVNVGLWHANGTDAQLWKLVRRDDAYLLVSKLRADLVLDLMWAGTANGTNVQAYTANGTRAQLFYLLSPDPSIEPGVRGLDGAYLLAGGSASSRHVADIEAGSLGNGANARLYARNDSGAQRLYLKDDGSGFYTITVIGTGKVLDVADGNVVPSTNVRQWQANGSDAQKWALRLNADGVSYTLVSKANGLVLDISGGVIGNGSNLQVYDANGTAAQRFWLIPSSILTEGIYSIRPLSNTGRVVDITNGSSASGAQAQIYASNGSLAQRFQVVYDAETGAYRLRTAASGGWLTVRGSSVLQVGSSLTAPGAENLWRPVWNGRYFSLLSASADLVMSLGAEGSSNGAKLALRGASGSVTQHFLFMPERLLAGGLYEFRSGLGANLVLDVRGGSSAAGADLQAYAGNDSLAQKFYLVPSGEGYLIKNFASGKVLDVDSASSLDGARVQQWYLNHSNAQLWRAEIVDGGGVRFVNVNSGKALEVAAGRTAFQAQPREGLASQRWTLKKTIGYGWVAQNGTWHYFYRDGSSRAFSNVAYSAFQAIRHTTSKTNYLLCIDNWNCRTIVFKGSAGNWEPVQDWLCSVGTTKRSDPTFGITARGSFEILKKGYFMGNDPDYFYWSEFFVPSGSPDGEGQRFHSAGFYRNYGNPYTPGAPYDTTIGRAETHGCVRLWFDQAKWLYDTCPIGSKVYSY